MLLLLEEILWCHRNVLFVHGLYLSHFNTFNTWPHSMIWRKYKDYFFLIFCTCFLFNANYTVIQWFCCLCYLLIKDRESESKHIVVKENARGRMVSHWGVKSVFLIDISRDISTYTRTIDYSYHYTSIDTCCSTHALYLIIVV